MVDADNAKQVVMLTEELLPYPHNPASIEQDQVDLIVKLIALAMLQKSALVLPV